MAVILDANSRRVIGGALDRTMEDALTLSALPHWRCRGALWGPNLVHHADRRLQYASGNYTDLLQDNGFVISISRKGLNSRFT